MGLRETYDKVVVLNDELRQQRDIAFAQITDLRAEIRELEGKTELPPGYHGVPIAVYNAVVQYLLTRPYKEVFRLADALLIEDHVQDEY